MQRGAKSALAKEATKRGLGCGQMDTWTRCGLVQLDTSSYDVRCDNDKIDYRLACRPLVSASVAEKRGIRASFKPSLLFCLFANVNLIQIVLQISR